MSYCIHQHKEVMSFLETRGTLARLLATENLIVEHDIQVHTASFDTDNRVLKLPVLKTESEFVYNMFVGHEVGHALQTPPQWKDDIPDGVPFDFVNVVEDVRIEKYIQNKFPGLRRDFTKSYDELNDDDFFAIRDTDISKLSLIDRINLHFKLGARALVPFTDDELVYVRAVDECETWQQVLLVSKMIHDYIGNLTPDSPLDDFSDAESGEGEEQSTEQQSQSNSSSDDIGDESESSDSAESGSDDEVNEEVSRTQQAFDESMSGMVQDDQMSKVAYVNFDGVDSSKYIVSVDTLRESYYYPSKDMYDHTYQVKEEFAKFLKDIKSDVNHLVQQFEMKKSADAYARQQVNKTGVLDTNLLHTYKLSDDIFLRQSILPDGKNHGMVMYLDWSGSMQDICIETVKQILILVQFCRKAHLPFEVYTFTTGGRNYDSSDISLDKTPAHETVSIVQVLSSTAKKMDIDNDMFHFFVSSCNNDRGYGRLPDSPHMRMGGTPLNNALLLVPDIISRFRQNTGAQKVSFVCVTDGESSPLIWYSKREGTRGATINETYAYYETLMLRIGSKVFPISSDDRGTTDMVRWLQSQLDDVSISHLYLAGVSGSSRYVKSITNYKQTIDEKVFRKEGCVTVKTDSWPLVGCINPKSLRSQVDEMEVDDNASKAQIKSALKKYLKGKSSSRLVLNQLVSQFS